MKKRLISVLLVVLMVMALFTGYSLSANAETTTYNTVTYRLESGDYVLRICQRLGLNYYVCKSAIMKLNNITENQWRFLPVGKLITLPATDADAVAIMTGKSAAATATTTTVTTAAATVTAATTTTTTTSASKDVCWYYIVPYQLGAGETVTDACNALNISFGKYKNLIQSINNIKNWNNISAGTTLWIPTINVPAAGTNCITVYAHNMASGETAYGVVTGKGLNYNAVKPMLQIINDTHSDLASFKTGETFLYPVATTIGATSSTVVTPTGTVVYYKLNSGIDTGLASVEFYVDGARVYQAKAGDVVTVSVKAKGGQAIKNLIVKYANGQADLQLKSTSFVMPKCDIRIDAEFMKGHKLELSCNYLGKAVTLVDGVGVNAAAKGASVIVSCTDPTLVIDEIYVSYKTLDGDKREAITNVDHAFVMPDADVKVEVVLKAVPTYAIYDTSDYPANGTFSVQVNGSRVTRAAKGVEVTIVPLPDNGYTVSSINIFRHGTTESVGVFNNSFTMPACDVDVKVSFDPKGNNILINPVEGGEFWATVGSNNPKSSAVSEAKTNSIVYLNWAADPTYTAGEYTMSSDPDDYIVIRNSDGLRVNVTKTGGSITFRMPSGGVTVTGGVVRAAHKYTAVVYLDNAAVPAGSYYGVSLFTRGDNASERTEFKDGAGTKMVPASIGEYINLSYNGGTSIVLDRYEVWNASNTAKDALLTDQVRMNGCFQIGEYDVTIRAYFTANLVKLDGKITGSGTVGLLDGAGNSVNGIKAGQPFSMTLSPSEGYTFDTAPADGKARLRVTRKDTGGEILPIAGPFVDPNTGEVIYSFAEMPAEGIYAEVVFDRLTYVLHLNTVDEKGDNLTGGGFWKIVVNGKETIVENHISTVDAVYGDTISFGLTAAGSSKYTFVRSEINSVVSKDAYFKISGNNARNKDIYVTIVLKPKEVGGRNPYSLTAITNDSGKRGSVGFVITASKSGYSTPDPNTYVTKAYTGDTVVIVPQPISDLYYTNAENVKVMVSGTKYIKPTPITITIGGETFSAYEFEMPEGGIASINVTFFAKAFKLTVDTNPADAGKGLFKVTYNDSSVNTDVLLDDTFRDAPYDSIVKIQLTPAAKNLKLKIDVAASVASISPAPVAKDLRAIVDGFQFRMPAGDTSLTVFLTGDVPTPPPVVTLSLPTSTTPTGLTLEYSTDAAGMNKVTTMTSGETYYVWVSGVPMGQKLERIDFTDGTNVLGSISSNGAAYTVSSDGSETTAEDVLVAKEYTLRLNVVNAPADFTTLNVNGAALASGATLSPLSFGDTVTIDGSAYTRKIASVNGIAVTSTLPAFTATGTFNPTGDETTIDVTVTFETPTYTLSGTNVNFFKNAACTEAQTSPVEEGTTVYFKGTPSAASKYVKTIKITDAEGDHIIDDKASFTVTSDVTAVVNEEADKTVTVQLTFDVSSLPSGYVLTTTLNGSIVTNPSSIANVKNGDVVKVAITGGQVDSVTTTDAAHLPLSSYTSYAQATIVIDGTIENGAVLKGTVKFKP